MNRILVALCTVLFLVGTAQAQAPKVFWKPQKAGVWTVTGTLPNKNLNGQCYAETNWTDGTRLVIIKDLADDELYLEVYNPDWFLPARSGHLVLDFNVAGRNERIMSRFVTIEGRDNILHVRNLQNTDFMKLVYDGKKMGIGMSDTDNPNLYLTLENSRNMIDLMIHCYKFSRNMGPNR
jgi:hypothetical protein